MTKQEREKKNLENLNEKEFKKSEQESHKPKHQEVIVKNNPNNREQESPKKNPDLPPVKKEEIKNPPLKPNPDLGHPEMQKDRANPASKSGEQNVEPVQNPYQFGTPNTGNPGAANQAI